MENKTQNGRISSRQLQYSIACFLLGSNLLTSFFLSITKRDSWVVVITGFLAIMPFIYVYITLLNKFPGKTLIEMHDIIYGRVLGKLVSLLYLAFFVTLTALNLRDMGGFVVDYLLPHTPQMVVLVIFMLVCAWAVQKGLEIIVRYSVFFVFFAFLVITATTSLTMNNMELKNFLPVLSLDSMDYIRGTHIVSVISFGEIIAFMMIAPSISDPKAIGPSYRLGLAIGALALLMVVLRDTAVLGDAQTIMNSPSYETYRMVNIGSTVNRLEALFAAVLLAFMFFKITILYYCSAQAISQFFSLRSYKPLVLVLGALIITYSLLVFKNSSENAAWGSNTAAFFSATFEVILPLLTLIIAAIRKFPGKKEQKP
jgi:spore germination protein KB